MSSDDSLLYLHVLNLSNNPKLPPPGDEDGEMTLSMPFTANMPVKAVADHVAQALNSPPYEANITTEWVGVQLRAGAPNAAHDSTIETRPAGGDIVIKIRQPKHTAAATAAASSSPSTTTSASNAAAAAVDPTAPPAAKRFLYLHADESTVAVEFVPPVQVSALTEQIEAVCPAARTYNVFINGNVSAPLKRDAAITVYPRGGDIFFEPKPDEAVEKTKEYMEAAKTMVAKNKYAQAVQLYRRLLDSLAGKCPVDIRIQILHEIGAVWTEARNHTKAIPVYKELIDLVDRKSDYTKVATYRGVCGKALFANEQYLPAGEQFLAALNLISAGKVGGDKNYIRDVRIWLGASWFKGGRVDEGIKIIQDTLGGDTTYDFGLMWMSQGYLAKDHPRDALHWAMMLLVRNQANQDFRKNFAEVISKVNDPMRMLKDDILASAHNVAASSAWAFMGSIAKDFGQVKYAMELMEHSCRLDPTNAGYTLNYIHMLELHGQYKQAINESRAFLARYPTRGFSNPPHNLTNADVLALMGPPELMDAPPMADVPSAVIRVSTDDEFTATVLPEAEAAALPPATMLTITPLQADEEEDDKPKEPGTRPRAKKGGALPQADLELLAFWFTIVKCFFAAGHLSPLPALCEKLNAIRGHLNLHHTIVRNEQAYFSSVCLAMQHLPPSVVTAAKRSAEDKCVVYVLGDSHSVPLSWRTMQIPTADSDDGSVTERVSLIGKLVTGLKIWHMRPESTFYPSKNFEKALATIPEGSDVLFTFGEIDCREGVLQAIDRGKYENLEEAFEKLGQIYVAALQRAATKRKMRRVFVQLPLAIIDMTRPLVLQCCFALRKALGKVQRVGPARLIVFDVNPRLLDDSKKNLRPEYRFDNTHASPAYLPLVEEAIAASY